MAEIKNVAGRGQGLSTTGRIDVPNLLLAVGATSPDLITVAPYQSYDYTVGDDSRFTIVVPEDWQPDSDITCTINWACNETFAAAGGAVNWRLDWELIKNDSSQVVGVGITGSQDSGDINIPTLARQLTTNTFGKIDGSKISAGDTIGITLWRLAIDTAANPTAEPEIYKIFFNYTRFFVWTPKA